VSGSAPQAREDSVRPRRLVGASGRPINFTVRAHAGGLDVGVWLAVGAGVGTAIGVATHKTAIGLALGVAVGAIVDTLILWARRS
jgi:hypothetical protein